MSVEENTATVPQTEVKAEEQPQEQPQARKISRAEKKMRDVLLKHNLKQLENVTTVTMRKAQQLTWTFSQPEVFYIDNVYVIFGEVQSPDAGRNAVDSLKEVAKEDAPETEAKAAVVEDETQVDASGLEENDITMVMQQANVSRARAVQALRDAKGDMVTAVMNLTI